MFLGESMSIESFKKHIPILMPIIGAGSTFLVNLIMKSVLSPIAYGDFAALLLIIITLYIIGLLGYEQVFIRLLKVNNGRVIIQKWLAVVAGCVLLLSPFVSFLLMDTLSIVDNLTPFFIICSLVIPASTLLSTLFKVSGDLTAHYMYMNAWKFFLLLVVIYSVSFSEANLNYIHILLALSVGFTLSIFISNKSNIKITSGGDLKIILIFLIAGMASITGYAIFDGMDRFIIKDLFSREVFGDYFFIFTFIMAPVSIISAYFTARKLPAYKACFDLSILQKDYFSVLFLSMAISLLFYLCIEILIWAGLIGFSEEYQGLMISVVMLAIIRGGYAMLSMAYTVVCSSRTLMIIGLLFGGISITIYWLMTNHLDFISIFHCILLLSFFWILRSMAYWFLIRFEARNIKRVINFEK